jgi:alpha-beta hydrolase superfamily lysophospholipase
LICLPAGAQAFAQSVRPALVAYREYDGLFHEIHNEDERALVFGEIDAWLDARLD